MRIEVAGPPYMRSGCQYALKIRQYQTVLWLSGGVAGSYAVEGEVVTFVPSGHLAAGTSYSVSLGAVADLAGNVSTTPTRED